MKITELLEKASSLTKESFKKVFDTFSEEEKQEYRKRAKQRYFNPQNKTGDTREEISPSSKYKLLIEYFKTGEGSWNYSQGSVYNTNTNELIGIIQRNYSSFPFCWIENHPNGHDYLVGGEDYQGQTVIELSTGNRKNFLPKEAAQGVGFCWASYNFVLEHQILVVNGCYWACPYEYRFYDFSDPMNGWPLMEVITGDKYNIIDDSVKSPEINDDGTITTYQTIESLDFEDYEEDESKLEWFKSEKGYDDESFAVLATKTFKIQDKKIVFQSQWVSSVEGKYRKRCEKARQEYEKWKEKFKRTDPLYLTFIERKKQFTADKTIWTGYTYEGWCPDQKFDEQRWGSDIVQNTQYSVGIEWAIKTGPVKLTIVDKKTQKTEVKFWSPHTVESMNAAFDYINHAKRIVKNEE